MVDLRMPDDGPASGRADSGSAGAMPSSWPHVWAFWVATTWAGGAARRPGEIRLYTDEGLWKGMLLDPGRQKVAFVTSVSLEGVLNAFEKGLEGGTLDWRQDRGPSGGRSKK